MTSERARLRLAITAALGCCLACGARSGLFFGTSNGTDASPGPLGSTSEGGASGAFDASSGKPPERVEHVSPSELYACALLNDGSLNCWGSAISSVASAPPPGPFVAVSTGRDDACAIRTDGTVVCWGDDSEGQTAAPAGAFAEIFANDRFTCGRRPDGTVTCWGGASMPPPTSDIFDSISVGFYFSCGIHHDGTVACWGGVPSALSLNGTFTAIALPAEDFRHEDTTHGGQHSRIGGKPMVVVLAGVTEECLEMVGDQPVEARVLRAVLAVLPRR